jgi:hypothetical protein
MKKPPTTRKERQELPELAMQPRRWRLIINLILCLVVLAIISEAILSVFATSNDTSIMVLFTIFFLICLIFLSGFIWSTLRLLVSKKPSFQAGVEGLTLRHLPFLGNVTLPWSEIKSVHTYRYLFLTYLCLVPTDAHELIRRQGPLRFAFNASSRFSLRTGAVLNVPQSLLEQPVEEVCARFQEDYGVERTPKQPRVGRGKQNESEE